MDNGLRVLSDIRLLVGEGPLWDEKEKVLYTIDVRGKEILKCYWDTGETERIPVGQMVGTVALSIDGSLITALEDGIYRVEEDRTLTRLHAETAFKGERFNDGKVGPDGAFYVGTAAADNSGAFYRLRPNGVVEELFDGVNCSNGLAWSRDRRTMYYCDSGSKLLEAFDFDPVNGTLANRRTVCTLPESGVFDGMSIDEADHLWVAVWDGRCIYEVEPGKGIVGKIDLPVSRGTCCTFAGEDFRDMVITTASNTMDLTQEPLAGFTLSRRAATPGRPTFRFAG